MQTTQTLQTTTNDKISGLYVITDSQLIAPKRFASKVRQALLGGAKVVQYRDKSQQHELRWQQAQQLVKLCQEFNAVSIINDDIELAKVVQADGVHIGLDDQSVTEARQMLGNNKIIGASCYADIERAQRAVADSADYVAFGSVFSSKTKPQAVVAGLDVLRKARQTLSVPVVAIGGIDADNVADVIAAGASSVAVISAVFASENIEQSARQFSTAFNGVAADSDLGLL